MPFCKYCDNAEATHYEQACPKRYSGSKPVVSKKEVSPKGVPSDLMKGIDTPGLRKLVSCQDCLLKDARIKELEDRLSGKKFDRKAYMKKYMKEYRRKK